MDLLSEWRHWDSDSFPYILKVDAKVLEQCGEGEVIHRQVPYDSSDKRLNLGLLPGPFMGDMLNASIYVLTLNPGYDESDYEWDRTPAFRQAVLDNLQQKRPEGVLPFICLDPRFSEHGCFRYWNDKLNLAALIKALAKGRGVSLDEARSELAEKLAVIELVPYHSPSFNRKWLNLPSTRLAGAFVRDTVVRRVRDKQAIVIVIRQVNSWAEYLPETLTEEHGVIRYVTGYRRPSLSPCTPKLTGGRAILRHLGVSTTRRG